MRLYIAGRFSRREELYNYSLTLPPYVKVTSRWLSDENHRINHADVPLEGREDFNHRLASEDMEDVMDADALVLFTPGGRRGGCHVEFGIALGAGKQIFLVGPYEHIFTHLKQVRHFDDGPHFRRYLQIWYGGGPGLPQDYPSSHPFSQAVPNEPFLGREHDALS